MKKHIRVIRTALSLVLSSILLFSVISCSRTEGESESTTTAATTAGKPDSVEMVFSEDNGGKVGVVYAADASAEVVAAAKKFCAAIRENTGSSVWMYKDTEKNEEVIFEVLLGNVNRDESKSVREGLSEVAYRVKAINGSLVLAAGSDNALIEGMDKFIFNYIKGETRVEISQTFDKRGLWSPETLNSGVAKNGNTLKIDISKKYQTVKYMGVSGCWVGNVSEYLTDAQLAECMDILYSKDGIGLTSYRFNVGAGDPMSSRGEELKSTECLQSPTNRSDYSLSYDASSVKVLDMAVERGANEITLFINSPPAYMTYSGYTAGNTDGSCNLKPEYYDDFATYAADIVELFLDNGYNVCYISPINEPSWTWGDPDRVWQEGCFYSIDQIFEIDLMVAKELERRGIKEVKVSFPETAAWTTWAYTNTIAEKLTEHPELVKYIDHFCAHSYSSSLQDKIAFKNLWNEKGFGDIPLHQTEWCSEKTGIEGAMEIARVLHEDFTVLECESWEFWVGMMVDQYSLITVSQNNYEVSPRLWALGNYSKFIVDSVRVEVSGAILSDDLLASAYLNEENGEIYLVVVNTSKEEKQIDIDGYDDKLVKAWETSQEHNLECLGFVDTSFGYKLPPESVTTFVISEK